MISPYLPGPSPGTRRPPDRASSATPSTPGGELPTTSSVGQIYLLDNPLLRRAARRPTDIKPRLLGHWGTTPGLNFM